jgi:hypothetical protein
MSSKTLNDLIKEADSLTPDEQLRLAAYLLARARESDSAPSPRHKWQEIRGLARPSLLGEDAQTWVSRTRREADEHRDREPTSRS